MNSDRPSSWEKSPRIFSIGKDINMASPIPGPVVETVEQTGMSPDVHHVDVLPTEGISQETSFSSDDCALNQDVTSAREREKEPTPPGSPVRSAQLNQPTWSMDRPWVESTEEVTSFETPGFSSRPGTIMEDSVQPVSIVSPPVVRRFFTSIPSGDCSADLPIEVISSPVQMRLTGFDPDVARIFRREWEAHAAKEDYYISDDEDIDEDEREYFWTLRHKYALHGPPVTRS